MFGIASLQVTCLSCNLVGSDSLHSHDACATFGFAIHFVILQHSAIMTFPSADNEKVTKPVTDCNPLLALQSEASVASGKFGRSAFAKERSRKRCLGNHT